MSRTPTGRAESRDGRAVLVLFRTIDAPIAQVWQALSDPERLDRWVGTYTGDPASGVVSFAMTAEAPDADFHPLVIGQCVPPKLLAVTSTTPMGDWPLEIELDATGGATELRFTHTDLDQAMAESVGPGWECYLDRLAAVLSGGDLSAIDFAVDYYPAMADHYRLS